MHDVGGVEVFESHQQLVGEVLHVLWVVQQVKGGSEVKLGREGEREGGQGKVGGGRVVGGREGCGWEGGREGVWGRSGRVG